MTEDQDNAGEVVAGAVRVALTAAGQLAEQAARRREADLREAERDSAARVATLQSQLAAERELALRSVRDVVQRGDVATVEEVLRAWEQAGSWDASMSVEQAQLEDRIRERFGVDPSKLPADRSSGDWATAVALAARDVDLQAGDARQRETAPGRMAALEEQLVAAGVDREAAAARALAAECHPTTVGRAAAQKPRGTSPGRPRGGKRTQPVEVQGPGR